LGILGVGIDITDIKVFRKRLDEGLINDLFLPGEIAYCSGRARPWESYAGRFAAKEALFKALGAGLQQGMRWKDVEITRQDTGAPGIRLTGGARSRADEMGSGSIHLSISHTRESAVAIVTIQSGVQPGMEETT